MRLGDFDTKTRQQAKKRSRGYCEGRLVCEGIYIVNTPLHCDHIKPIWLWDLADLEQLKQCKSLSNCQVLCAACHALKTGGEAGVRAKNNRVRAKHNGQPQRKKRKIPSRGFDSQWRKKLNGEAVRRHDFKGSSEAEEDDV